MSKGNKQNFQRKTKGHGNQYKQQREESSQSSRNREESYLCPSAKKLRAQTDVADNIRIIKWMLIIFY